MSVSPNLPTRIPIVKTCVYILTREAISLLREKRAREVYENGKFIGIELNYVNQPEENYLLPPAELPGLRFEDPNPQRKYARLKWTYA